MTDTAKAVKRGHVFVPGDEYDAMWVVEVAARRLDAGLDRGVDLAAVADLRIALADLNRIRHPGNGKTGEARL